MNDDGRAAEWQAVGVALFLIFEQPRGQRGREREKHRGRQAMRANRRVRV
jgi:hypothetical protein